MDAALDSLLKGSFKNLSSKLMFASIFGSYRRGVESKSSDIDVFLVYDCEGYKVNIADYISKINSRVEGPLHVTAFNIRDFEERVRFNDYLLASILEDSRFLCGDMESYSEWRAKLLSSVPNNRSIEFNFKSGLTLLDRVNRKLKSTLDLNPGMEPRTVQDWNILKYLRDSHLAVGYLLAASRMKSLGRTVTLRDLLRIDPHPILKRLISTEKSFLKYPLSRRLGELRRSMETLKRFTDMITAP